MNIPHRSNAIEMGDIFRQYGVAYRKSRKLPLQSLKAISAIESCRTAALGGHVDECDSCGHVRISYNSCRNRHYPKCQSLSKERWLEARKKELLPVSYFHVVLTIPYELNPIALINQKEIYDILFKSGTETLRELGTDPEHLGAENRYYSYIAYMGTKFNGSSPFALYSSVRRIVRGRQDVDTAKEEYQKEKVFCACKCNI